MRGPTFSPLSFFLIARCALGHEATADQNSGTGGGENGIEIIKQKMLNVMLTVTDKKSDPPKPGGLDHSSMSGSFAIDSQGIRVAMDGSVKGPLDASNMVLIVAIVAVCFVVVCIALGYYKYRPTRAEQLQQDAQPADLEEPNTRKSLQPENFNYDL